MTNTDTERRAFEAKVRTWPNYSDRTLVRDGRYPDYYGNPVVQGAWEGWVARAEADGKTYQDGLDKEWKDGFHAGLSERNKNAN